MKNQLRCYWIVMLGLLIIIGGCAETLPNSTTLLDGHSDVDTPENAVFLPYERRTFSTATQSFTSSIQVLNRDSPEKKEIYSISGTNTPIQVFDVRFNGGVFNTANLTKTNYRLDTLLYSQDNALYQLDLFDVLQPSSIPLSSEFQANSICHERDIWEEDFTDFTNSRYIYFISSDCQSGIGNWYMVKLSMGEADPPKELNLNIDGFVTSLIDLDSGAINGWLATIKGNDTENYLNYLNVDFTITKALKYRSQSIVVNNQIHYLTHNKKSQLLIAVDDSIVWYNARNNLVDDKISILSLGSFNHIQHWRSDGDFLYFSMNHFDSDGSTYLNSTLSRVSLENAEQVELLSTESFIISNLEAGYGGLVFAVNGELKRYSAIDQSIRLVPTVENYKLATDASGKPLFYVTEDTLLTEHYRSTDVQDRLVRIQNQKKPSSDLIPNTYIVGLIYQNFWQMDKSRTIEKVILENQINRELQALVPAQYPATISLGILPTDISPVNSKRRLTRFYALGHDDILFQVTVDSLAEIFFIHASKANSLLQITNNQTVERVVNF